MARLSVFARAAAAAALLAAPWTALGHGSVQWSVGIGIPGPWYYAPPYYPYPYYPPAVAVPAPSTYVEQPPANVYSTQPVQSFYYYCPSSKAYYPYVRECASPWERVPTQPR